jgi:hypothetical protein
LRGVFPAEASAGRCRALNRATWLTGYFVQAVQRHPPAKRPSLYIRLKTYSKADA